MSDVATVAGEGLLDALVARRDAMAELPDGSWGELLDAPALEESNGVEELRQLAEAIATQLLVDKVWAGRADGVRVRTACPACSRRQVVGIPFLHHTCESCGTPWEPRRCHTCARTRVCAKVGSLSPIAAHVGLTCRCGGELETVRLIPLQRTTAAELPSAASLTGDRLEAVAVRRNRPWIGAGAAVAVLAVGGVLFALPSGGKAAAAAPAAPASAPASPGSSAALGLAARHQLTLSGRSATTVSCQTQYDAGHRTGSATPATPGTVDAAFLRACVGG